MAKIKTQNKTVADDKSKAEENGQVFNEQVELLKSQLARTLADYDNLKRRTDEEKASWAKFSALSIVSKLLPIMDMLESAQTHLKDAGLAIALTEFKKVFVEEGLVELKPEIGSDFDEETGEVVEVLVGESNNTIAEVVMNGWKFKDGAVVRHAKVKVFKSEELK